MLVIRWLGFKFLTDFFLHFLSLVLLRTWFSMHKQSLPEEDECTQASCLRLALCWVGV